MVNLSISIIRLNNIINELNEANKDNSQHAIDYVGLLYVYVSQKRLDPIYKLKSH